MMTSSADRSATLVSDRPWRTHEANLTTCPPTMLSPQELGLLHWLAAKYMTGQGAIIDAGCFLGGSTAALAQGWLQNPLRERFPDFRIQSYDLFQATGDTWTPKLLQQYDLTDGCDFQSIYRRELGSLADLVDVHANDLLNEGWGDCPVELLFLDICKSAELHDHAAELWFPRLIPGHSIVIQQDYGWSNYAWGNVVMAALTHKFERLDDLPYATRVYRCIAPITIEEVRSCSWRNLSDEAKTHCMDHAIAEVVGTELEPHLIVNRAILAREVGDENTVYAKLFDLFYRFPMSPASDAACTLFPDWFAGPTQSFGLDWIDDPRISLVCQMGSQERLFLYSAALALRPRRILEIGRARGGSTLILQQAIRRLDNCRFVSLDPNCLTGYKITPEMETRLAEDVFLIHGFSPYENQKATELAGGKFDLVFIDGDHSYNACIRDIEGVLPYLETNAVILLHDAFYPEVADAIKHVVSGQPSLVDCGMVACHPNDGLAHTVVRGRPCRYAGLHQLRWTGVPAPTDGEESIGDSIRSTVLTSSMSSVSRAKQAFRNLCERVSQGAAL